MPYHESNPGANMLTRVILDAAEAECGYRIISAGTLRIDGVEYGPDQLRDIVRAAVCVANEGVSADGTDAQIAEHARLVRALRPAAEARP